MKNDELEFFLNTAKGSCSECGKITDFTGVRFKSNQNGMMCNTCGALYSIEVSSVTVNPKIRIGQIFGSIKSEKSLLSGMPLPHPGISLPMHTMGEKENDGFEVILQKSDKQGMASLQHTSKTGRSHGRSSGK